MRVNIEKHIETIEEIQFNLKELSSALILTGNTLLGNNLKEDSNHLEFVVQELKKLNNQELYPKKDSITDLQTKYLEKIADTLWSLNPFKFGN